MTATGMLSLLRLQLLLLSCTTASLATSVVPLPLPAGHNGGIVEQRIPPAAAAAGAQRPHIMFVLWDDYGEQHASSSTLARER